MSHYVGVHGNSADKYNVNLLARYLGETIVEAAGDEKLCDKLGKNDKVSGI